jgi:hypothetical protein
MKTTAKSLALLFLATGIESCDISHLWDKDYMFEVTVPQDGILVYDCSSYTDWHFFSFDRGEILGSCDALDAVEYESWRVRNDWDLAFHRQNIKTNSGASGVGVGGMLEYKQKVFDFDAVGEAPEEGYLIDVADSVIYDMSQMAAGKIGYAYTGLCPVVKGWATLTDMMAGIWTYADKVFIVRTATGKYAKIHLRNFKSDIGASGTITMEYIYQKDGTVFF